MKRIRRWLLLFAALTALVVRVESLKATSLIFAGKNSKATTTTTSSSIATEEPAEDKEEEKENLEEDVKADNDTGIKLTGIPQIDYQWDPNLPRELNGFNLSNYPFLDSVPTEEDIAFKCDDEKKGFYASIKYSCQLYHHCLYGYRSDFICPNYTSFDQKTFICHFVNKVDCKNSEKYWNRNDDLYIPTTVKTTTVIGGEPLPTPNPDIYKRPPPAAGIGPRRRPQKPRRPPVDYYYDEDDYEDQYEERGRRRPQRPRNRRPEYADDDDDYDNRRPYERERPNRRPYRDEYEEDYEYERPRQSERDRMRNRNRNSSRRNNSNNNNDDRRYSDDRRFDGRRPNKRPYNDERRPYNDDRRPVDDDRRAMNDDRRSFTDDRRSFNNDKKPEEEKRPIERRPIPRLKNKNRDNLDDVRSDPEDERIPVDESKFVKPTGPGSSVYDRPRVAPKISRPVPLSERNKFAYKTTEKPKPAPVDDEYYDDYEDSPPPSSTTTTTTTTTTSQPLLRNRNNRPLKSDPKRESNFRGYNNEREKPKPIISSIDTLDDDYYEDYDAPKPALETPKKNRETNSRPSLYNRNNNRDDYQEDRMNRYKSNSERYKPKLNRDSQQPQTEKQQPSTNAPEPVSIRNPVQQPSGFQQKKYASKQTVFEPLTTTQAQSKMTESSVDYDYDRGRVRIIKRPFLPSRGGNPYKARGLQPVGTAATTQNPKVSQENKQYEDESHTKGSSRDNSNNNNDRPKNYYNYHTDDIAKTTLEDIYNEDFDVNLNDALDPTIRPLSSSPSRIDEYSTYDDRPFFSSSYRRSQQSLPEQRSSSTEFRSSKIPTAQPQQRTTSTTTSTTTTTTPAPVLYEYDEYEEY